MKKLFCVIFCAAAVIVAGCMIWPKTDNSMQIPEDTKVIIHLSSQIDPRSASPLEQTIKSYSKILYYDENGVNLGEFSRNDEIINDFIVQGQNSVAYFFKNDSILSTHTSERSVVPSSDIRIRTVQFGPKDVGHIEPLDLFYAYFNMGGTYDGNYQMVLRLFSETDHYDIVVPYYSTAICFDEENRRFVCEVSSADYQVGDVNSFQYVVIAYNEETGRFSLDERLYSIPYNSQEYNGEFFLGEAILSAGDKIYRVSAVKSEAAGKMKLVLSRIDLSAQTITHSVIKDSYAESSLGHPYIIGSADTPMSVHNDKLYIFTSDFHLVTVNKSGDVEERDFPYVFSDARSIWKPYSEEYFVTRNDFFDSLISVEDDGYVYVLTVSTEGKMCVYQFMDDNSFALVWEAELPEKERKDLMINTFELIT